MSYKDPEYKKKYNKSISAKESKIRWFLNIIKYATDGKYKIVES